MVISDFISKNLVMNGKLAVRYQWSTGIYDISRLRSLIEGNFNGQN